MSTAKSIRLFCLCPIVRLDQDGEDFRVTRRLTRWCLKAITSLDREQSIDTTRRYVTGISRGGYGSWNFITKRPDMFAAAIPVCEGENPQLAENIVGVSVWAFHGAKDKNVPVNGSRDMIEGIKQAGGNPRYTEYPNEAHNIWHRVSQTPDLLEWLFAQTKADDASQQH